eukprot:6258698-Amphidinium_carterae.1
MAGSASLLGDIANDRFRTKNKTGHFVLCTFFPRESDTCGRKHTGVRTMGTSRALKPCPETAFVLTSNVVRDAQGKAHGVISNSSHCLIRGMTIFSSS